MLLFFVGMVCNRRRNAGLSRLDHPLFLVHHLSHFALFRPPQYQYSSVPGGGSDRARFPLSCKCGLKAEVMAFSMFGWETKYSPSRLWISSSAATAGQSGEWTSPGSTELTVRTKVERKFGVLMSRMRKVLMALKSPGGQKC